MQPMESTSAWRTKRKRGNEYGMGGAGEWFEQMDAYQEFSKGKTAEELKAWGETGLDENGKPVEDRPKFCVNLQSKV